MLSTTDNIFNTVPEECPATMISMITYKLHLQCEWVHSLYALYPYALAYAESEVRGQVLRRNGTPCAKEGHFKDYDVAQHNWHASHVFWALSPHNVPWLWWAHAQVRPGPQRARAPVGPGPSGSGSLAEHHDCQHNKVRQECSVNTLTKKLATHLSHLHTHPIHTHLAHQLRTYTVSLSHNAIMTP